MTKEQTLPEGGIYKNAINMKLARIEPGAFTMGSDRGDLDEQPTHRVTITRPFYMGITQVTNAQYERFDPAHRQLRGKLGFSAGDDEAVVFVSWHEAAAYCRWLSGRDGRPYRLPTEAEWEYACRAGTATEYSMGEQFARSHYKHQRHSWYPDPVKTKKEFEIVGLAVGEFEPNAWGLYDMHGNVEEWVQDWYGPYEAGDAADPSGRMDGDFKVARGGSHSTEVQYLRSAERMAALPEDKHWMLGFRVVLAEPVESAGLPAAPPVLYQQNVPQEIPADIKKGPDPKSAYFAEPKVYVKVTPSEKGPFFKHNHSPYVAQAPNGDLLAVWFTTNEESGREMKLVASRLRYGSQEWDEGSVFWDAPDRNMTGGSLWNDGGGKLVHVCGMGAAGTWGTLVQAVRTSADNGVTWSKARLMTLEHGVRTMPIPSLFRMSCGSLVLSCDAETGSTGGSNIWISDDEGDSWYDAGGLIAGIHAPVAELSDGRLLAYGRGDEIHGRMARSLSSDKGRTWTYSESEFDPIGMGQRAVLRRLSEGPLFFASFSDQMELLDRTGAVRRVNGLFAAVSYDDGQTWPYKRLVSTDREDGIWDGGAWTGEFKMDRTHAEPKGYLAMTQGENGLIHLLSSRIHYSFNLQWILNLSPGMAEENQP